MFHRGAYYRTDMEATSKASMPSARVTVLMPVIGYLHEDIHNPHYYRRTYIGNRIQVLLDIQWIYTPP
jgi:hypothetical protein